MNNDLSGALSVLPGNECDTSPLACEAHPQSDLEASRHAPLDGILTTTGRLLVARLVLATRYASRHRLAAPGWWALRAVRGKEARSRRQVAIERAALELARQDGADFWPPPRLVKSSPGLAVAVIGPQSNGPGVVVKLAEEPRAVAELRRDGAVRARLGGDPRLGTWANLLPEVVSAQLQATPAISVERHLGTADGRTVLAGCEHAARPALRAALEAISQLHDRTGHVERVDEPMLHHWLDEPLTIVRSLYRPGSWQEEALRHLREALAQQLTGAEVTICWAHGDYSPGNLLYGSAGTDLEGIVDWGGATDTGLACLDTTLLVVTTVMLRHHLDLGTVLMKLMSPHLGYRHRAGAGAPAGETAASRATGDGGDGGQRRAAEGRWQAAEETVFGWARAGRRGAARGRRPTFDVCAGELTATDALWLCWARHIARNLLKSQDYARLVGWRVANIDAVLANFARLG